MHILFHLKQTAIASLEAYFSILCAMFQKYRVFPAYLQILPSAMQRKKKGSIDQICDIPGTLSLATVFLPRDTSFQLGAVIEWPYSIMATGPPSLTLVSFTKNRAQ